jgi:hypothetical protein
VPFQHLHRCGAPREGQQLEASVIRKHRGSKLTPRLALPRPGVSPSSLAGKDVEIPGQQQVCGYREFNTWA